MLELRTGNCGLRTADCGLRTDMEGIDTALKTRIQAFKAEKKGKKMADRGVLEEVMDETAG